MSRELDKFGQFIMENFRDCAIDYYEVLAKGGWKAPSLKPLQTDLSQFTEEQLLVIRRCMISTIDTALHDFLSAVQEASDLDKGIKIMVDETNIAEVSDGLPGELFSEDGWFAKFSKYGEPPGKE